MRSVYEDGEIDARVISSKTKVAPTKQQSAGNYQDKGCDDVCDIHVIS